MTEGTYWFIEKDAPEGYVVNSEPVTAYVSAADIQGNKTVTVEATNHRKPGLEIVKIDSVTKEPVANCTFDHPQHRRNLPRDSHHGRCRPHLP